MTILVTGGTGRTGGAVAQHLHDAGYPFLILTRSVKLPPPYEAHACRFDFLDPSTFHNPFNAAKDSIEAVYLAVPMTVSDEIAKPVTDFIDFARHKGVKRFVLLSSNVYKPPTRIAGAVHQYLMDCGGDLEYAIIRPTWFMGKPDTQDNPSTDEALTLWDRKFQPYPCSDNQRKGHHHLRLGRWLGQVDLD